MFQEFSLNTLNTLSSTELETLRYINNHKAEVIDMSIQDLAKVVFVSTSTIIRLCKKLDLEGFSNLKYFLKQLLKKEEGKKFSPKRFSETVSEDLDDIIKTAKGLSESQVDEVVELIRQNHRIHFFAKGLTEVVFEYASRYLLSLSKFVTKYTDTHIAYAQANNFSDNDVVFLASMSGETQQVVRVAQIAKAKGAKVVTFTASLSCTLSKLGDYNFYVVNTATSSLDIDTKSRSTLMFLLDVILKRYVVLQDR